MPALAEERGRPSSDVERGKAQCSESGQCKSRRIETAESPLEKTFVQERSTTGGNAAAGKKIRGHDSVKGRTVHESESVHYG
ncbi:MAG: hypothetical protein ABR903_05795 [Thermodesulfovibrionales bacterium]|jgi:hypothetical protein